MFVTEWFRSLAEATKKGLGLPDLNLVTVPHPFDSLPEAEAIKIADQVLDKAVAAVTTGALVPVRRRASTPNEGRQRP